MAGFTLSCHTRHGVSWVNPSFIDLTEYRMVHRRGFFLVMVYAVSADLPCYCTISQACLLAAVTGLV
ncbi:MAG: hypothetical protein ACRC4U_09005, partial [Shewanella sp.]